MPLDTLTGIAHQRLRNQRLVGAGFATPEAAVAALGAVQSQDYGAAKWGIAQRIRRGRDAAIEAAFESARIVRTHVMRPTWHFVVPADLRWILALTAPRVRQLLAYYDRQLEVDAALLRRSNALLARTLCDHQYRTRDELGKLLQAGGIAATGQRLGHLLMHAELDAQICSGPRRGKQFTYALLDERVPASKPRVREDAVAELALRYFASHGPALAQDFAWWSGLTVSDAKLGIELNRARLSEVRVDGKSYWFTRGRATKFERPIVHLLPNYDEHLASYKDYTPAFDRERVRIPTRTETILTRHLVALDGQIVGGWQRALEKTRAVVEVRLLRRLAADEREALEAAAQRYGGYLGLPVDLTVAGGRRREKN